jgi:hypothetical protein
MEQFAQRARYGQLVAPGNLPSALRIHQQDIRLDRQRQGDRLDFAGIQWKRQGGRRGWRLFHDQPAF